MKNYIPRLLIRYNTEIKDNLKKNLNISNEMRLPKLVKIVLNMGLGNAREDKNTFKQALNELSTITGQKAVGTKSKKAISNFKIREGDLVGASVILRSKIMYEFFDRFISVASPRIRDFRGFSSKGFDGRGNYNFGVSEQIIFPEINYDKVNAIRGMNISLVTTAHNDYEAYELLKLFGFPINEYKKASASKKKSSNDSIKPSLNSSEETIEEQKINEKESELETSEIKKTADTTNNEESSKEEEKNIIESESSPKEEE